MNETIKCEICFEDRAPTDFIHLLCNHSFCKSCLAQDWTEKINLKKIDESFIKCSLCNLPINYYILKQNLSKEVFERYEAAKFEFFQVQNEINEKKVICPQCMTVSMIWKDADYFKCPTCKRKMCSQEDCYGQWEKHEKLDCLQFRKKFNDNDLEKFRKLQKAQGWTPCPRCQTVIEKTGNCNIIRCESGKCQKKTVFCYLCGKALTEAETKTHFIKDEFHNECKRNNVNLIVKQDPTSSEQIKINRIVIPEDEINDNFCKRFFLWIFSLIIWFIQSCCCLGVCCCCACCFPCSFICRKESFDCPSCKNAHPIGISCWCCCCNFYTRDLGKGAQCPFCKEKKEQGYCCSAFYKRRKALECCKPKFEIEENFNGYLGHCKSSKCKDKLICLTCKIKLRESEILDHFAQNHGDMISQDNSNFFICF